MYVGTFATSGLSQGLVSVGSALYNLYLASGVRYLEHRT